METDKVNLPFAVPKNQDIISYFQNDDNFVFAYKKTEKLASAVYMVTNLFGDSEPMKWTLRRKVSELMSFILGYKEVNQSTYSDFLYGVKTRILEIVSLLEVSSVSGLISHMNFSILKREFSNLIESLDQDQTKNRGSVHDSMFKGHFDVSRPEVSTKYKDQVSFKPISNESFDDKKDFFKRNNRQNIIIGLLKRKKDLTIKDISLVIKDCSEKTIQRELISLISSGVIRRIGERRWSKYSLV